MSLVPAGLLDHHRVHLSHDDSCTLTCHIHWSDAVFDPVGTEGALLHDTDAATRERDSEGAIAKAIVLGAERETRVGEEAKGEDWLLEASGIIKVLCEALTSIVVDVESDGVKKSMIYYASLNQRIF